MVPSSAISVRPSAAISRTRGLASANALSNNSAVKGWPITVNSETAAPATVLSTPGLTGASASDFYGYLESIGNLAADKIHIAGQFNGATSVEYVLGATNSYSEWHNAAFYSYTATYEAAPL